MSDRPELTKAEWKVMKIAWELGSFAARDACEQAGSAHGMSVSTVKTHLRRIVEKGYLKTTQIGNSFLYTAAKPALGTLKSAADALLNNAVQGTTAPLLAYMVQKSRLTAAELAELRALLDRFEGESR